MHAGTGTDTGPAAHPETKMKAATARLPVERQGKWQTLKNYKIGPLPLPV